MVVCGSWGFEVPQLLLLEGDYLSYLFHIINTLIALLALGIAWKNSKHAESEDSVNHKIRLAVLEDRVHNIIPQLEKAIEKLEDKLNE